MSCANTGEILAALLRPGNSGSNTAADHVAVLSEAVAQLPAAYRKKIIFRADGAGSTKEFLTWIKTQAARRGYTWHWMPSTATMPWSIPRSNTAKTSGYVAHPATPSLLGVHVATSRHPSTTR